MKLSEAIEKINELIVDYGDIELVWLEWESEDYRNPETLPLNFVVVTNPVNQSEFIATVD